MKKKILIIVGVVIFLFLFLPVPIRLRDGGSVEYKSIIYKITDVKRLNSNSTTGYEEGIIIEIFGFEVFNNVSYEMVVKVHHIDGVSMKIKEGSLTDTSMVIIIEDLNNEKYTFRQEFYIEKKESDRWKKLEVITDNYGFNEMGYLVVDDNLLEMKQDWSNMYGKLLKGNYRLVKNIYKNSNKLYFSVEFKI